MIKYIDVAEYKATFCSKRRSGSQIRMHYAPCMHSLITRWASRLTAHQLVIMMFILDRTLYHDKMSETVVFDQFLHGMVRTDRDERVFCGLNISLPTLLKQLKELADGGFLHVFACRDVSGRTEIKPRLYAIDCKKLFNLDIADEENPMILREPKQKRVAHVDEFDAPEVGNEPVSRLKTPKQVRRNDASAPPQKVEGIYIYNTDTKVSNIGVASRAESASGIIDPTTIVARIRQQRIDAAQARKGSLTARQLSVGTKTTNNNPYSKVQVQATLDDAMNKTHPTLPRVVVSEKPLGVLKKRVVEAKIDMHAFLTWAINFWTITVSAHERASRRRAGEESKHVHKPLPAAPDFATLCYRFPYFAACFRSHVHTESAGLATSKEEQLQRTVDKLQRAVVSARQDVLGAQQRERNMRQRINARPAPVQDDEPTAAIPRVRRAAPALRAPTELDDDLPPTWDEHPVTTTRRVRK